MFLPHRWVHGRYPTYIGNRTVHWEAKPAISPLRCPLIQANNWCISKCLVWSDMHSMSLCIPNEIHWLSICVGKIRWRPIYARRTVSGSWPGSNRSPFLHPTKHALYVAIIKKTTLATLSQQWGSAFLGSMGAFGTWSTWLPCINRASWPPLLPPQSHVVSGEWLLSFSFFLSTRTVIKSIMPTAVPFPSAVVQPEVVAKEAYVPGSTGSSVTGTLASSTSRLKRHKHYYMTEGNIVIQVCSVAFQS